MEETTLILDWASGHRTARISIDYNGTPDGEKWRWRLEIKDNPPAHDPENNEDFEDYVGDFAWKLVDRTFSTPREAVLFILETECGW